MKVPAKHIAKESIFVAASLTCMCLIITFTAFVNAGLDINKMFSAQSLPDVLLNAAITIFGTVAAVPSGIASTKQRRNPDGTAGRYIQDFTQYNAIRSKIEPKRILFNQWHREQHLKEQRQKCIDYLLSKGVIQAEDILKLNREQVSKLTTSQMFKVDGEELYFKSLSPAQIKACLDVLNGKVLVHKLPDYYFLYFDGKSSKTFYDQAYYESRDENFTLIVNLMSKIFIGFVITCILTGLVISKNTEDLNTAEFVMRAIILALARIFNALSSTLWGWLLGQDLVYKQCYYLNGRTQFLELFQNDNTFVPKTVQEQAKLDYESEKGDFTDEDVGKVETSTNILD